MLDAPAASTTVAPAALLATLARLVSTRFSSFAEATAVYLSTAARLTGVRSAFISRLDSEVMEVLGSWDDNGCNIPAGGVVPLEETFCQYVRADSAPMVVHDAAQDPRVANVATRTDFTIGSYLGVPLLRDDGELLGSFCLLDPEPQQFSQDQLHAMEILAQQLARLLERELAHRAAVRVERETAEDLAVALSAIDERDLLLRTAAHDLRTPLTSIRGYADMLAHGVLGPLNDGQRAAVGRIGASSRFMHRLANDLLDVSQAAHGNLLLASEPYGPADLLAEVADLCAGHAAEHGLALVVEPADGLPAAVGDPVRVQQILLNLVSNAIVHGGQGRVVLRAALLDGALAYSVADSGPGIAPDLLPRIWDLNWRGGGRGTGLGLYLVRRLCEAMGGSAEVESRPGAGCTFTVRLPLAAERPVRARLI